MAVTLGSTGITFPDATTQTTAATGGGAIRATFTAAAAITAGQTVQFTTGTNVTPVTGVAATQAIGGNNIVLSSPNTTSNTTWGIVACAYDPNTAGSFVAVGINSSGSAITLVAGTTSNNTTTVGTVVSSALSGSTYGISGLKVMFDPVTAGKGMVIFVDGASSPTTKYIKAIIFTVSGTTATIQSTTTLYTGGGSLYSTFSYYGQDIFVFAYSDGGSNPLAQACSISTYTITQGTQTTMTSVDPSVNARQNAMDMDYSKLTANLLGLTLISSSNSDVYAVLMTVVPATKVITSGSAQNMIAGSFGYCSISFDPLVSTRFAVAGSTGSTAAGYIYTGQISGTAINATYLAKTFAALPSGGYGAILIKYLSIGDGSSANSVLTYYYGTYIISGPCCCLGTTTAYFSSGIAASTAYNAAYTWQSDSTVFSSSATNYTNSSLSLVSGQTSKVAISYGDASNYYGRVVIAQAKVTNTNLDSTKVIGIANASASSSASVVVNLWGGISTNQSGLTPNTTYYVDATGALTTSSTAPSLSMGKALTASTILLKTTP